MNKNIKAIWSYSLICECPECNELIDICGHNFYDPVLDSCDPVDICETDTRRTTDYEITCDCGHEFLVDFVY